MNDNTEIIGKIIGAIGLSFLFALLVKVLWNSIVTDWGLPEITYWKSFGLMILCGVLFKDVKIK